MKDDTDPGGELNLILAVKDHAPVKIKKLAEEASEIRQRLLDIEQEVTTLSNLCYAVGCMTDDLNDIVQDLPRIADSLTY